MLNYKNISEEDLKNGGELFELFWLRPGKYAGQKVVIRLRINKKWGGWKLKDEPIESTGLKVGDTISTEITPYFTSDIIDDDNDTDLFGSDRGGQIGFLTMKSVSAQLLIVLFALAILKRRWEIREKWLIKYL